MLFRSVDLSADGSLEPARQVSKPARLDVLLGAPLREHDAEVDVAIGPRRAPRERPEHPNGRDAGDLSQGLADALAGRWVERTFHLRGI